MIRVNLRRMTECGICERPAAVEDNRKLNNDESDRGTLCNRCMRTAQAYAGLAQIERELTR